MELKKRLNINKAAQINMIKEDLAEDIELIKMISISMSEEIADVAVRISDSLAIGGKVLVLGNGGSAADAQHFAAELVGRFEKERQALAAIALTTDTSILTAVSNDYGYEYAFVRQIEALARPADIVIAVSTSGASPNVVRAAEAASDIGCKVVALTGASGGDLSQSAEICLRVPSRKAARIQEAHITIIHLLCRLVEAEISAQ